MRVTAFLLAGAFLLMACRPADDRTVVRVATFNIAMGMSSAGAMGRALQSGEHNGLQQLAAILRTVRPDLLLLNEFDYQPDIDAAKLLNEHYLKADGIGGEPIEYAYSYRAPVNTGLQSGLDIDANGRIGDPGDAWGFGQFPGQYGMLVLSRYPIDAAAARSLQRFRWKDMPGARRPVLPDSGQPWHTDAIFNQLRLSSKSHWDIPVVIGNRRLHWLAFHPTPPVFDGPEDRNGLRNHDEIRLMADYITQADSGYITDDQGQTGGLKAEDIFVIAGDLNADPHDGDSVDEAVRQLLDHPTVNHQCIPHSRGAVEAASTQAGANLQHRGGHAADTSDFNDQQVGNLRLDYLLPSALIDVLDCGVFWPAVGERGADWVTLSDHRLVWMDIRLP